MTASWLGESRIMAETREWRTAGNETRLQDTEYVMIREDDVLGILDSAAEAVSKAA